MHSFCGLRLRWGRIVMLMPLAGVLHASFVRSDRIFKKQKQAYSYC